MALDAMMLWSTIEEKQEIYDWFPGDGNIAKQENAISMMESVEKVWEETKARGYEEPYDFEFLPALLGLLHKLDWGVEDLLHLDRRTYLAVCINNRSDESIMLGRIKTNEAAAQSRMGKTSDEDPEEQENYMDVAVRIHLSDNAVPNEVLADMSVNLDHGHITSAEVLGQVPCDEDTD